MPLTQRLRAPLIFCLVVLGIVNGIKLVRSFSLPEAYGKDFFQEYLLARAAILHLPPYTTTLQALAQQIVAPVTTAIFPHASPHPPPVVILALPLGLLAYQPAMVVWLIVELTCLYLTCSLLVHRFFRIRKPTAPLLLALGLFSSFPISLELGLGQLMVPILLLLTAGWLALRSNKQALGGALIGLSLALKFFGWPLIPFLLWRKQWRPVVWAATVFIAANLVGVAIVGASETVYYYRHVGPFISKLYRAEFLNFSTWATGYRLFAGTESNILQGVRVQPLLNWPAVAPFMSIVVTGAVLCLALLLARVCSDFDCGFAVMVCASVVVNPIAWHHYLVVLSIPAAVAVRALARNGYPGRLTFAAIVIGIALLLPHLDHVAGSMAVGTPPVVPAPIGLIAFLPLVATLGLMVLVWRSSKLVEHLAPSWHTCQQCQPGEGNGECPNTPDTSSPSFLPFLDKIDPHEPFSPFAAALTVKYPFTKIRVPVKLRKQRGLCRKRKSPLRWWRPRLNVGSAKPSHQL